MFLDPSSPPSGGPNNGKQALKDVVYIIDDDVECCRSTAWLLKGAGIAAETFASAEDFLAANRDPAGCVLLDVRMPGMNGLDLQRRLAHLGSWPAIVVMSGYADVPMALRALEAGAVTLLEKPFSREQLFSCLRKALTKAAAQIAEHKRRTDDEVRISHLTPREREVFAMVIQGNPTKNIARSLSVSTRTVDKHRERILAKTGIGSWAELVALGVRLGMAFGAPSCEPGEYRPVKPKTDDAPMVGPCAGGENDQPVEADRGYARR